MSTLYYNVLLLTFNIILVFSLTAQYSQILYSQEKYFTELRGMEDSLGNTHLFYRIYETFQDESKNIKWARYHHVYHYDVVTSTERIKFSDFVEEYYNGYGGGTVLMTVDDYLFWNNDPDKWITGGMNSPVATITRYDRPDRPSQLTIGEIELLQISQQNDSLVLALTWDGLVKSTDGGYTWPKYHEDPDEYLPFWMLSLHKYDDMILFGLGIEESLAKSTDRGESYTVVDDTDKWMGSKFYYDPDSVYIYGVTRRNNIYRSVDNGESWERILTDTMRVCMTLDEAVAGEFYISRGKRIYKTNDHGDSFTFIDSLNNGIIDLYKNPGSDKLYAATKYDIYEITSDTKRSIKSIPVSVEIRKPELPFSFVLYQNYPNPFNPSTTIPFSIPEPSNVTIEVYDIIGRLVGRIADDRYDPGYHSVVFDAHRLSSGTYIIMMRVTDIGGTNRGKMFNHRVVLVK